MEDFYKDMPSDFKRAVSIIKRYCQNESCDIWDCKECPYPVGVIRSTDTSNYDISCYRTYCEFMFADRYLDCKDKNCGECDFYLNSNRVR